MLKRIVSMVLCVVMLFTMVPAPAFASEASVEETVPMETVLEETEPTETTEAETEAPEPETTAAPVETTAAEETTAPAGTAEATEPAVTEETAPAQTVPAETVPELTVPEETVSEETAPEETAAETEPELQELVPEGYAPLDYPGYWYLTEEAYTWTEEVTVMEPNGDGTYRVYDTTETFTETYLERHEVEAGQDQTNTLTQYEDNIYTFTQFSELEQLAAHGDYDTYTRAKYVGSYPFTIERSITLPYNLQLRFDNADSSMVIPEGVTFTNTFGTGAGSLNVGSLTVNGTFVVNDTLYVTKSLKVTGEIRLVDNILMMAPGATVSGSKNVVTYGNQGPRWDYSDITTESDLRSAVSAAKNDSTGWDYLIEVNMNYEDITLSSSLTIPDNVQLNIWGRDGTFTIASGATLTVNAFYCYWDAPITVAGKLVNNCSKVYVWHPVTVTGIYGGSGALYVNQDVFDSWDAGVIGLDVSDVVVSTASWGSWWCVRDLSDIARLGKPTNVAWNKRTITRNGEVSILDAKGYSYWKVGDPDEGNVILRFYDYDTDELIATWNCGFGGQPTDDRSVEAFIDLDPPSGSYYFTVTSMPDNGSEYYDSLAASSGKWTYTQPGRKMPQCTNLQLNFPYCTWTDPSPADEDTIHQVEFFFTSTEGGTPSRQGRSIGSLGTRYEIWSDVINRCGAGWYSFKVRAVPDDITQYRIGEWSEMSEAFYYDPATFAYDESWILEHRGPHPSGDADMKLTFTDVPVVLRNDFTVPSDMTLDIAGDGCITVPAGKTLTLNCDQTNIYNGGRLIVEEGGTVIVNSSIYMYLRDGHIENRGQMIFNDENYAAVINIKENGSMGGTTSGVPLEYVHEILHLGDSSASYRDTYLDFFESGDYGHAELYIHNDITLPDGFTIPRNGTLFIWRDAELTVPAGNTLNVNGSLMIVENGRLYNNGTIKVYGELNVFTEAYNYGTINMMPGVPGEYASRLCVQEDACFCNYGTVTVKPWSDVVAYGEWEENYPNNMGGDVHGPGLSMTQAQFAAEVKAAKAAGEQYTLQKSVEITKSMTLEYQVILSNNATVTVHDGATLTLKASMILQPGADLLIREGAKLKNNASIYSNATSEAYGVLGVSGTYVHGEDARIDIYQDSGTPAFFGIEEQYLTARFEQADEEALLEALEVEGYGTIQVWTDSLELNTDITIPANMTLIINPTWSDLQNGTRNDWVKINSNVTVYGALNPNAFYNGTPCNLEINGNIEVMPGGNMYTCGNVRNYGRVHIHAGAYYAFSDSFGASWTGNQPIIDMTEEDLRGRIGDGQSWINLNNVITLTDDLDLPQEITLNIYGNGGLIVPDGVTLTMDGRNYVRGNGQLIVEEGGTLALNNDLHIYDNVLIDIRGQMKFGNTWCYVCRKYDSGWDNVTVEGIPLDRQAVNVFFRDTNADAWEASANIVEENIYGRTYMMVVGGEITLPRDMTLPKKTILHVDSQNTTLIIPEGMTLNNNGSIYVWPTNALINNGTLNNYCYIAIYGRLDNYGTVSGYAATPDSQFTNEWSTIAVLPYYNEGCFNNFGTVTVYPHAEVFAISNWEGSDPVKMGGEVTMGRYQGDQNGAYLSAGKSMTLKVWDYVEGKTLAAKTVTWSVPEEYGAYATITAKGKLTARNISEAVTIEAVATIKETGEEVITTVHLFPSVTQLEIRDEDGTLVNGQTVPVDVSETERSFSLRLYPLDLDTEVLKNGWVSWTVSDKKEAYASYSIENGVLTVSDPTGKTGTVTVKVSYTVGTKKSVTFKLNFGTFAKSVEILNTDTELTAGSSLQLTGVVKPIYATKSGIKWSLKNAADKSYVSLSSSGKLKAKTVYGEHEVTVVATSKDGEASAEYTITILPKDTGILTLKHNGKNVTKSTVNVDLNVTDTITLTAENFTGGSPDVTWKSSKTSVAMVSGGKVVILKKGSATITATAADGRKATVTVKASQLATDVIVSGGKEVASGKSIKLTADVKNASSTKVTWSIEEGAAFAKISSSGKLTANKDITSAQTVVVRATAKDGGGACGEWTVTVRPLAQGVQIVVPYHGVVYTVDSRDSWWFLSYTTIEGEIYEGGDQVDLSALVYPYYEDNDDLNAIQGVDWKSSSQKVATIDENGTLTILDKGTTTITATARDGSGKKVSFKLKISLAD